MISAILLGAGQGTRMKSTLPKILHKIGGCSLIDHVIHAVAPLSPEHLIAVLSPAMEDAAKSLSACQIVYQEKPLGTGDAVKAASRLLRGKGGDVLILYGDTPFIRSESLQALLKRRREADNPALVLLGMRPEVSGDYGRYVTDATGYLQKIVEAKDATEEEKKIDLCNGGILLADGDRLWDWLDQLSPHNKKGEFYLTDLVEIANKAGRKVAYLEVEEKEILGINDRIELAEAEALFQQRRRREIMEQGVTLVDPSSVYLSFDTEIGRDCIIEPHVFFGINVKIAENVQIKSYSHLEDAVVEKGAIVGPFARLRPGSRIGSHVHIGNFVEIKNSVIEGGAKINHLSYIGDTHVGMRTNIGAGTITCNYDGFRKARTEIGPDVFVGSHTSLIAPVTIGQGAIVGAGSVITANVEENALALSRSKQEEKPGWAKRFRDGRKK